MKKSIEQIHLASQYLAAAGISFLPKEDDDSHTNLGWDGNNNRLTTHNFGTSNSQLGLNLTNANLEWLNDGEVIAEINVKEAKHSEILSWISDESKKHGLNEEYQYNFHYELPYPVISNEDSFDINVEESTAYAKQLSSANKAMEKFLVESKLDSPIRVWPHHFDLGIYAELRDGLAMGAGLAVPDTMVNELYYYSAAYRGSENVSTKSFSGLKHGEWRTDWDGATLTSMKTEESEAFTFLIETKQTFEKG